MKGWIGGPECAPCELGKVCVGAADCVTGYCASNVCLPCTQQTQCHAALYCDLSAGLCLQKKGSFSNCEFDYECESGTCNFNFGAGACAAF